VSTDTDLKILLDSLRQTLQFENEISTYLRAEYEQFLCETFTSEEMEQNTSLKYRITKLYAVKGSISGCFEMYMGPYIEAEDQELRPKTIQDLENDLRDPVANTLKTENLSILHSSLLMFNKIKHLLKRYFVGKLTILERAFYQEDKQCITYSMLQRKLSINISK